MAAGQPVSDAARLSASDAAHLTGLNSLLAKADWFVKPSRPGLLTPGTTVRRPLAIPQRDAQAALREVVRLVADLPVGSSPTVVWQSAGSELLVDSSATAISCTSGLIRIGLSASCDQVDGRARIQVPFSVGTSKAPAGLAMTTLTALEGPSVIVSRWAEALTAFAWESLLELCRRLCERLGSDARGHPLVPGSIMADQGVLLILPMARNDLDVLTDLVR
jgi:hypothetical protein